MCFKTNVTYKKVPIHLHAPEGHFDDSKTLLTMHIISNISAL